MATIARRLVSTNKLRWQEDGYDLDLSYITPRIIAMGFPSKGVRSLYRNPMRQVVPFLQGRHAGHYKVYNLCIESGYGYSRAQIKGPVLRLHLYDGQAPPQHLIQAFCQDATTWLQESPKNVVVVHCKAGKGRTGALICCLLLHLMKHSPDLAAPFSFSEDASDVDDDVEEWPEVSQALRFYGGTRTMDGRGLTIASQRRSVAEYYNMLHTQFLVDAPHYLRISIQEVNIYNLPSSLLSSLTLGVWVRPEEFTDPEVAALVYISKGCQVEQLDVAKARQPPPLEKDPAFYTKPSLLEGRVYSNSVYSELEGHHIPKRGKLMHKPLASCKDGVLTLDFLRLPACGDIKIQVFKGRQKVTSSAIFTGGGSQFSAWISTAFPTMAKPTPGSSGKITLQQNQLDKVSKSLRKLQSNITLEMNFGCLHRASPCSISMSQHSGLQEVDLQTTDRHPPLQPPSASLPK